MTMSESLEQLRRNDMMSHLLDALESGEDIGHYGRLVFAMVAQYFSWVRTSSWQKPKRSNC